MADPAGEYEVIEGYRVGKEAPENKYELVDGIYEFCPLKEGGKRRRRKTTRRSKRRKATRRR